MSSRIYRPGKDACHNKEPQPIVWRRQGAGWLTAAKEPDPDTGLGKQLEERIAAAYQQGRAAGEAESAQRANSRLDPVLAGLSGVIGELAGLRKRFRADAEEATVALAIAIARRVLNREISSDPDAILGLVKAAFQKCDARETHILRLSPADAQTVHEHREQLDLPPALEVVADGRLTRGSAIFETSRGDLDASADTQLAEIERGFADVLRRRNR